MPRLLQSSLGALALAATLLANPEARATGRSPQVPRSVIVFVADGLRRGSVTQADTPALYSVRKDGVDFVNSHSLFPTFTTPNASSIATGHQLGDTGDYSNTVYLGYPIFNDLHAPGTPTPFLENNQVLADVDEHATDGNYLNEESLLALARQHGYQTAAIGKMGPVGIQDVTQLHIDRDKTVQPTTTVFIDDATGTPAAPPLPTAIRQALTAAGLELAPPKREQSPGGVAKPGTLAANERQQAYFADATTRAVLPTFVASGKPFALVYWSRDPDGTQHFQGDSFNANTGLADQLRPGINGPTSRASIRNADANLAQILAYLTAHPEIAENTDLFVTSDHGFATISRREIDAAGHPTQAYAATFTYKNADGIIDVAPGFLPPGFLAIDLAHLLGLPLFDPDSARLDDGTLRYAAVEPTITLQGTAVRQHPLTGNALLGGSGVSSDRTDATLVVVANGGSDLIYAPGHDGTVVRRIVEFLATQDYVGALFVDSSYGDIPGALPLKTINLEGAAVTPRPAIAVAFRTFSLDSTDPLQSAVQVADTGLQEGQGMHGSFGRDNTFNNMAAMGPDFKHGFIDTAPVGNADIAQTLARILGLPLPARGALAGRVLLEALAGGPAAPRARSRISVSRPAANGAVTILEMQTLAGRRYLDRACQRLATKHDARDCRGQ